MREILFRGKRKDINKWIEGWYVPPVDYKKNHWDASISYKVESGHLDDVEVIPETVGQYTGLTDKNGKKIFEGDIVAWNNEKLDDIDGLPFKDELSVVQFCEERKGYIKKGIDIKFTEDFLGFDKEQYRVIGNIHDNPELLKEMG